MDARIRQALANDRTIDITTIGRRSGNPSRIETWFYRVDDRFYLTGSPGKRDWYANLTANPTFTFHLKGSAKADLLARAQPIEEKDARLTIFTRILQELGHPQDLDNWMATSPLAEVSFEDSST